MVERRRLGVGLALDLAGVGVLEDVEALGVGGHHPVLDPVVDHLHEVAGAVGAAVQVAVLGRRRPRRSDPGCARPTRRPGPAWRRSGRAARPPRPARRSSGSSRARGRRRRRWCRSRRSRFPARRPWRRGGCRRGSRSCRRRRSRRRLSSTAATASTVDSVISPAGTITQTERGALSFAARSSSEEAPSAPSPGQGRDRVGVDVVGDDLVAVPHQAARHVGAHPAEADDPEFHQILHW